MQCTTITFVYVWLVLRLKRVRESGVREGGVREGGVREARVRECGVRETLHLSTKLPFFDDWKHEDNMYWLLKLKHQ